MARFLVINPNTNERVTAQVRAVAEAVAAPGNALRVVNPPAGPLAIESAGDKAEAVRQVLSLVSACQPEGFSGYLLACFDDLAVAEVRHLTQAPVISLAEAGIRQAMAEGGAFRVITTFPAAVADIQALAKRYGAGDACSVVATHLGVTETAARTPRAEARLDELIRQARQDGCATLVLGSGAFAGRAAELGARYGIRVLDGFREGLTQLAAQAEGQAAISAESATGWRPPPAGCQ